jgi:putative IMPACT (imprinted ancient) family translation regulator
MMMVNQAIQQKCPFMVKYNHYHLRIYLLWLFFFGGVKLGVGVLISAYRTTAQMTLESCEIIEKTINVHYR